MPVSFFLVDVVYNHCPYNGSEQSCNSKIKEVNNRVQIVRHKLLVINIFEHSKKVENRIEYRFSIKQEKRISANPGIVVHTFGKYLS